MFSFPNTIFFKKTVLLSEDWTNGVASLLVTVGFLGCHWNEHFRRPHEKMRRGKGFIFVELHFSGCKAACPLTYSCKRCSCGQGPVSVPWWSWVRCSISLDSVHQSIVMVPHDGEPRGQVQSMREPHIQVWGASSKKEREDLLFRSWVSWISHPCNGHAYFHPWLAPRCGWQVSTSYVTWTLLGMCLLSSPFPQPFAGNRPREC